MSLSFHRTPESLLLSPTLLTAPCPGWDTWQLYGTLGNRAQSHALPKVPETSVIQCYCPDEDNHLSYNNNTNFMHWFTHSSWYIIQCKTNKHAFTSWNKTNPVLVPLIDHIAALSLLQLAWRRAHSQILPLSWFLISCKPYMCTATLTHKVQFVCVSNLYCAWYTSLALAQLAEPHFGTIQSLMHKHRHTKRTVCIINNGQRSSAHSKFGLTQI